MAVWPFKGGTIMSTILVETSARHLHVTREVLDILFGEGY